MASFSRLPNELVYEIASYVMPEDIENFSVASKRIFDVAWPFLKEHRQLKKRYAAFDNIGNSIVGDRRFETLRRRDDEITTNCSSAESLSDLLTEVLTNRKVAQYIKELRLERWSHRWRSETFKIWKDERTPHTEEQFSLFKQALSKYVLPEKLETWIEMLELGSEDPITSLLLILLPNVNSITDKHCLASAHILKGVAERIKTDFSKDVTVLNRLEQIHIGYFSGRYDVEMIILLAFLATMPSLKSLYIYNITTRGDAQDFSCLLPNSSNITTLCFERCKLSIENLQDLLQGLKSLRNFSYIYRDRSPWDPAGICNTLLKCARRSLETLDLRGHNITRGPIQCLQHFEGLKNLALSFSLFQASQIPRSIRNISLHDYKMNEDAFLSGQIREVVKLKEERFAGLEKVCICSSWDLRLCVEGIDELRGLCEGAGFELLRLGKSRDEEGGRINWYGVS